MHRLFVFITQFDVTGLNLLISTSDSKNADVLLLSKVRNLLIFGSGCRSGFPSSVIGCDRSAYPIRFGSGYGSGCRSGCESRCGSGY